MNLLKSRNYTQKRKKWTSQIPKRSLSSLFERARVFIENIKPSENILLIHHTDVDGYCSCAIFFAALEQLNRRNIDVMAAGNEELENLLKFSLKNKKLGHYEKLIILDLDAPYLKEEFEKFKGQILMIDHHTLREDLNSKKVIYVNPRFENEEVYQPTSYVVYKFFSSSMPSVDLRNIEWLAVLGTIGDFAFDDCTDLLNKWVSIKRKKDLTKTDFWKASKMLYGVIIAKQTGILSMLLKYKSISELKSDKEFLLAYKNFEKEYKKREKEFWDNAEKINNIIISTINPAFKRVGSALATNIGLKNHDKIIILLEKRGKKFKIHSRCQSGKVHMGMLMEKCAFLGGGGHRHAAGGTINTRDLKKFKECVISSLTV